MLLLLFSKRCIQLEWVGIEQISCGGSPPKKVCSRSSSSFASWPILEVAVSRGKVWHTQVTSRAAFFCMVSGSWQILTLYNIRKRHLL
jgi:hypothetical protein